MMFDLGKIPMNKNFRTEGLALYFLLYKVLPHAINEIKPLRYNQTCSCYETNKTIHKGK
jgi:SET domain-containing protein